MRAPDPRTTMRPYRKVDMGKELEDHGARLKTLEEDRSVIRAGKWLFGLFAVYLLGLGVQDCKTRQEDRMQLQALQNTVQLHVEKPHPRNEVTEETVQSMQQIDEEHDRRLQTIEYRLRIKRK